MVISYSRTPRGDVPRRPATAQKETTEMQAWVKPDFTEILLNCECTAYAGVAELD
jgi:hypothetical protein